MNPPDDSLDARIQRLEQRLVAREDRLRQDWRALGRRVDRKLQPWRRAAPAIGVGLVAALAFALAWRWRRYGTAGVLPHAAARPAGYAGAPTGFVSRLPWAHLLALGWPLLPSHWRARVSPATASTAVALVLPLFERLRRRRQSRAGRGEGAAG